MSVNGYAQVLIDIDDKMLALGRPPPPVVSWLSGGLKGDIRKRDVAWRQQVLDWEKANPDAAASWYELREEYKRAEETIEAQKFSEDAWSYQRLARLGVPQRLVDGIRSPQDYPPFRAAKDWTIDSAWCLVLLGGTGIGKSYAAAWAAHQSLMRKGHVKWVRCAALVDAPLFGMEAELLRHQCRTAGLLVLDDIGAGAREKDSKAWLGWLDDVLDARWGNRRRTVITSNQSPEKCIEWLGPRLADRLQEGSVVECGEGSHRGRSA